METLKNPAETKAIKEHRCNFCGEIIRKKEIYETSTHVQDGSIYTWKSHMDCAKIATRLQMYDYRDEGLTMDAFQESISEEYFDLLLVQISKEDRIKYAEIIQQLHDVKFKDKLYYVIRHYAKIDKK